jgi:hypothetical protein
VSDVRPQDYLRDYAAAIELVEKWPLIVKDLRAAADAIEALEDQIERLTEELAWGEDG